MESDVTELESLEVRLKDPATIRILNRLLDQAEDLSNSISRAKELEEALPNLSAVAMDVLDEWAVRLKQDGIDVEAGVRQGLRAALWLGSQIRMEELERLGYLLRSDVMNEHSVETVGIAGSALASCRRGTCEHPLPSKVGLYGLIKAMRDPNVQRALAFALQFAKCFGSILGERREHRLDDLANRHSGENA